jgi:RNA polymerase sigma-70 factor (ECF subfamily)
MRLDGFSVLRASPDPADDVGWEDPLLAALARLSSAEQEALRLVAWEGLALAEGAVVAGCSVTAFKVRLFRARRHMRLLLNADAPGQHEVTHRKTLAVHKEGQ